MFNIETKKPTFANKLHTKILGIVRGFQGHIDRGWYSPLLGILAFLDYFIFIIPMDGILISSVLLKTKKWLNQAIWTTLGSTAGAILFYYIVRALGISWIIEIYPKLDQGEMWKWSLNFFTEHGIWIVFFIAATPLIQQPVVAFAAVSTIPPYQVITALLMGRLIKYLIICYISSHSPHLISKMWGLQDELSEVGLSINNKTTKTQRSHPE